MGFHTLLDGMSTERKNDGVGCQMPAVRGILWAETALISWAAEVRRLCSKAYKLGEVALGLLAVSQ